MAKKWEKKADKMWQKVIKQVGHCERCLATDKQLHAHHIIGRTAVAYRHDPSNGVCLCASCHTMSGWSAHHDRTGFLEWFARNRTGQYEWFLEHTLEKKKLIGNEIHLVFHAKPREHISDEAEYDGLKEMLETL